MGKVGPEASKLSMGGLRSPACILKDCYFEKGPTIRPTDDRLGVRDLANHRHIGRFAFQSAPRLSSVPRHEHSFVTSVAEHLLSSQPATDIEFGVRYRG